MPSLDSTAVLNRLLILHHRSLPTYLGFAEPWYGPGDEAGKEALGQIVADQRRTVDRLGEMVLDRASPVSYGAFPLRYSAWHDISFAYLRQRLVEHQRQLIREIEACVDQLQNDPLAQAVAQEALGEAKAHLQSLRELDDRSPAAARIHGG